MVRKTMLARRKAYLTRDEFRTYAKSVGDRFDRTDHAIRTLGDRTENAIRGLGVVALRVDSNVARLLADLEKTRGQ